MHYSSAPSSSSIEIYPHLFHSFNYISDSASSSINFVLLTKVISNIWVPLLIPLPVKLNDVINIAELLDFTAFTNVLDHELDFPLSSFIGHVKHVIQPQQPHTTST